MINQQVSQVIASISSPSLVLIPQEDSLVIFEVNEAYAKTIGIPASELEGKFFPGAITDKHDIKIPNYKDLLQLFAEEGNYRASYPEYDNPFVFCLKGDNTKETEWWLQEFIPLDNGQNKLEFVIYNLIDVTAKYLRKQYNGWSIVEQQNRIHNHNGINNTVKPAMVNNEKGNIPEEPVSTLSEDRYKYLFENNPSPMFVWDFKTTKILDCNEEALLMYGYTREEFLKLGIKDIRPAEDISLLETFIKNEENYQRIHKQRWRHRNKSGDIIIVEVSGHLLNYNGRRASLVQLNDITEKVKIETELKASEKRYKMLFNKSPIPKWIFDVHSLEIVDVNESSIKKYGYSKKEFLQMTFKDLMPNEDWPIMEEKIESVEMTEGIMNFGINTHIKKDKSRIKADVSGHKIYYSDRDCMLIESIDVTERERATVKMKENEAQLKTAQKIAKLGYWQKIIESDKLFWSDEVYSIWGVNKKNFDLDNDRFLKSVHPDDMEGFRQEMEAVFSGKKDHDFEHRIVLQDGTIKWVHEIGKLIKDEQGKTILFEGTVQDITEEMISREKLQLSEARHRGLLDSQTNYVIRTDLEGRYSYANNKYINDYGWIYRDNNIIGKNTLISIADYHHKKINEVVCKCVANPNKVFQVELDKPTKEDKVITTLWDIICLTDSKGKPTEIQCIGIDISDRKKAEAALIESISRYELVSKATSDAIWDVDMESNITYRSEGFKSLFGYDPIELDNGKIDWTEFIHPGDKERVLENLDKFIESKENNWKEEYRYLKADGSYAFVLDKGFVIRDENGKAKKMVGAMQDITDRKTLQNLLNKSNRLARIGSWEIDVIKGTVYWSPITKEIREVDEDFEPTMQTGIEYFKEEKERDTIFSRVNECISNGTPWDEELQIITHKGNVKWVRTIGEAEMVNGKCVKVYGSFQDIDDKKKAELEVLKLYEEKNKILESIADGFFAVDINWTVTYWNAQAEKMLSIPKNRIFGKCLWEFFEETIDSPTYENYHRAMETKEVIQFEAHYRKMNTWYEINIYPSENGLSVFFKDITNRKKAEEEIRLSNERYTIVSKATNDSIWDWDLNTNVVDRPGQKIESLFGYIGQEPEEVDAFWKKHVFVDDWKRITKKRDLLLSNPNEDYWEDEYRYLKPDGTYAEIYDRAYIIRDKNGKAIRMIGASRDITKLKENENQLRELNEKLKKWAQELAISNAELEQFAYVASHDLQEPLRMVTSFLTLLENKYSGILDEKGKQFIYFAVDGANRMRQIILDLLEYSRVGKGNLVKEKVDMNELLREIIILYQEKIKEQNAVIKINKLPVLITSVAPLRQVFQNLISNSLKYFNSGNGKLLKITISCKPSKTHWQFSVKDNGIGIEEQYFDKIFVIFQRLHNKEHYSGTGMGLAITKKIIENLGGKIWVDSAIGKGSTFYFTILKNNESE